MGNNNNELPLSKVTRVNGWCRRVFPFMKNYDSLNLQRSPTQPLVEPQSLTGYYLEGLRLYKPAQTFHSQISTLTLKADKYKRELGK